MEWYQKVLEVEIEIAPKYDPDSRFKSVFLEVNDFHLELIEKDTSYHRSEILTGEDEYLGGIFKIGFATQNIEKIYNQLKSIHGIDFVTEIQDLPPNTLPIKWPKKHFLVKDPDGNYIQFFDTETEAEIMPWLMMITVEKLENAIAYYTQNLAFKHYQTIGEIGNRRAILAHNNQVLELFEPRNVVKANELSTDRVLLGFNKLGFEVDNFDALKITVVKDSLEVIVPPEKSTFGWTKRSMMLKDGEGNLLHFFEI